MHVRRGVVEASPLNRLLSHVVGCGNQAQVPSKLSQQESKVRNAASNVFIASISVQHAKPSGRRRH